MPLLMAAILALLERLRTVTGVRMVSYGSHTLMVADEDGDASDDASA